VLSKPRWPGSALIVPAILQAWVLALVAVATLEGQRKGESSQILIESLSGRDSFERYCSTCHGRTGQGDGHVAQALAVKPTDLSQLAQRNGGVFPADQVRATLTWARRPVPAHGTSEMPIWGSIFSAFDSEIRVRDRIENLVAHIESLQLPSSGPNHPGGQLFKVYCASCHGLTGRGDGPVAEQLRKPPPDLTKYAARNGGVFPSERLREIIDGTGVATHGDRDMPVWGDAFQRSRDGLTPEGATKRIDALVRYLETIQERSGE